MSLLFVAAEAREFSGILRHAGAAKKLSWPIQFARAADLHGRPIVLLANGPGPNLAAQAAEEGLRRLDNVEALISTGYCGALERSLRAGSIFVASSINGSPALQPRSPCDFTSGQLLSQDRVACTVEEKSRLNKAGSSAVEMEAAGVAKIAKKFDVPFYCVRVVTDAASDPLALDFNRVRDRNGRFSRARILAAVCHRPWRIVPELVKLERTCKRASLALGDFIADCRF